MLVAAGRRARPPTIHARETSVRTGARPDTPTSRCAPNYPRRNAMLGGGSTSYPDTSIEELAVFGSREGVAAVMFACPGPSVSVPGRSH
eukprot:9080239-Pyramimonas_sp.AAC.1